ncbi:hypothetical protein IFM89_024471 [Coptis chinensis]|uniref:Uncharacterized protein n=1 Tax=Coptis chinensis TaxID=261450 RepID=A0A835H688_9MAGN|nr:hypothetical protein IFM89_024471 [Coptis chinensis]
MLLVQQAALPCGRLFSPFATVLPSISSRKKTRGIQLSLLQLQVDLCGWWSELRAASKSALGLGILFGLAEGMNIIRKKFSEERTRALSEAKVVLPNKVQWSMRQKFGNMLHPKSLVICQCKVIIRLLKFSTCYLMKYLKNFSRFQCQCKAIPLLEGFR